HTGRHGTAHGHLLPTSGKTAPPLSCGHTTGAGSRTDTGSDTGTRGEVTRGSGTHEQRKHHPTQAHVDVHELCVDLTAVRTLVQVGVDLSRVTLGQCRPHVRSEQTDRRSTLRGDRTPGQVHLQICLAQPFPCPVGQGRHPVGLHPQQGSHFRWFGAL